MKANFDTFRIQDECKHRFALKDLGEWAILAFQLGYRSYSYDGSDNRYVTIVSVPSREMFTAILVLGALVADATVFEGDGLLTWKQLKELDDDQLVYFTDRKRVIRGYLGEFNEEYQARTIRDAKSATHFVFESNFRNYEIRFNSPKSKGKTSGDEDQFIECFNKIFNLNIDKDWLRTMHPNISLNIVKHAFTTAISKVEVVFEEETIPLGKFLNITESTKLGSGKVFIKSEKNSASVFNPKVAILSSGSFEKLIRQYSHSDIVITLEHHEYDESVAAIARSLRDAGEDSSETLEFSRHGPDSVRVISKVMRRVA
jgi:hypothetical protein